MKQGQRVAKKVELTFALEMSEETTALLTSEPFCFLIVRTIFRNFSQQIRRQLIIFHSFPSAFCLLLEVFPEMIKRITPNEDFWTRN